MLRTHPHATVLTVEGMLRCGMSRELIRSAVRSGWLTRFGHGAYTMLEETVGLEGAIWTLQNELNMSVHQAGYTVLSDKYGKSHNLYTSRKSQLFAYRGEKLPAWFSGQYSSLFDLHTTTFLPTDTGFVGHDAVNFTIRIPSVERAILEMLYLTPSVHTIQETYQVMELITTARPAEFQQLLESCTSVKVKRLFLYMAERTGYAWFKRISLDAVDLGRGDREITRGGHYDRKYHIIVGNVEAI